DPLITRVVDLLLGAKGYFVVFLFGSLINQRAIDSGKGDGLSIAFDNILANFRTDKLKEKTQIANNGVVSADGMPCLAEGRNTDCGQGEERNTQRPPPGVM